jgi:hypothetical protein
MIARDLRPDLGTSVDVLDRYQRMGTSFLASAGHF